MFNIGPQELLLILLVALVIVGPKRLPELSRTIGRGLREFRKAQDEVKKTINLSLDESEPTAGRAPKGGATELSTAPPDDGGATAGPPEGGEAAADTAADVARTLGRGLAEIRQARRQIQRTFRVDLTDESPPRRTPPKGPPSTTPDAKPVPTTPPQAEDHGPAGPETPA